MPRARALSSYPPAFAEIVERAAVGGDTLTQTVVNKKAAQRLQGKFYAYRQAVRRELDMVTLKPAEYEPQHAEAVRNLWQWVQVTVCWFDRALPDDLPVAVSFMHRDRTPEAQMLQNILDANRRRVAGPVTDKLAESQRRLLEKLGEDPETDSNVRKYYDR